MNFKKMAILIALLSIAGYTYAECRYVTIYPIGGLPETILVCD